MFFPKEYFTILIADDADFPMNRQQCLEEEINQLLWGRKM
jgi:hypothetical protein